MDAPSRKKLLRREIVGRILGLDPAERSRQEAILAERFADLPGLRAAGTVLMYVSAFPEEIDLGPMILHALDSGKVLICPRVDHAARRLRLYQVEDLNMDLAPGTLGIPEPRRGCREVAPGEVDWALIPGLAFDPRGFRLGRGAGHYDRLLPQMRAEAPRWALALDCQWVDDLPVEPHDVPLDGVVSPGRTFARGENPGSIPPRP